MKVGGQYEECSRKHGKHYFELFANLLPDCLFELLESIGQVRLGLIVVQILVAELVQNGILDVFILQEEGNENRE